LRTWYVAASILDNQRLLAQHREIHTIVGSIMSPKRGYQHHPAVKLYNNEHLLCLRDYHGYVCDEMKMRGWHGHQTVFPEVFPSGESCDSWATHVKRFATQPMPAHGIERDMHDLIARWSRERKPLRNDLSATYVEKHRTVCHDQTCEFLANVLLEKYEESYLKGLDKDL